MQSSSKSSLKYAGTQTEKNLQAAFAGESQARNKYTYFASVAKKEGYAASSCSRFRSSGSWVATPTGHIPVPQIRYCWQAAATIASPSKFPGIDTKEDLRTLVKNLRDCSGGRPIGIKIAAGKIEKDLAYCVYAEPDFITIDGRGLPPTGHEYSHVR
mgnify:CR=1 FL=1